MGLLLKENSAVPNFWPIHLITWSGYALIDLSINLYRFKDFTDYLVWFDTIIMGFLIVTSLRYVYLRMFAIFPAFNKQLVIIILFSLSGGCLWFFLRGFSHIIIFPERAISFTNYYRNFALPFGLAGSIFWLVGPVFGWSLSYLSVRNYFFLIEERNTAQKMQILAKNAQLQMLRYQINPHFLFNSLNSVKALIIENPEAADNTITALSEFLQATLKYNEKIFIPVKDEMEIIKKYLMVEKIRYEERLTYFIAADEGLLEKEIPCFITQPLVENSVKHGLIGNPEGINLKIKYRNYETGSLTLEVINSGKLKGEWSYGLGLSNLLERLENSYQNKYIFSLRQDGEEVVARIEINQNR